MANTTVYQERSSVSQPREGKTNESLPRIIQYPHSPTPIITSC